MVNAMLEIRRILCPTDLSDIAPRTFENALALARFHRAEVELLYVSEPLLPGTGFSRVRIRPGASSTRPFAGASARRSTRSSPRSAPGAVSVTPKVVEGRVVAELLARARSWPADLIVMGTHGRGGFERWVLGSVTEKVLRQAPCPVLTVPPPAIGVHPEGSVLFRRIVCPVDFSPASLAALSHALRLAEESCAELHVLHVVEWLAEDPAAQACPASTCPSSGRTCSATPQQRLADARSPRRRATGASRTSSSRAGGRGARSCGWPRSRTPRSW